MTVLIVVAFCILSSVKDICNLRNFPVRIQHLCRQFIILGLDGYF